MEMNKYKCNGCFGAANGDCEICENGEQYADRKELMKALHIIKDTCVKNSKCEECPLGGGDVGCIVNYYPPDNWKINDNEEVWRALL